MRVRKIVLRKETKNIYKCLVDQYSTIACPSATSVNHHNNRNGGTGGTPRVSRAVKFFDTPEDAIFDVPDHAKVLLGGFGVCGIPEKLIEALTKRGNKQLTIVSNNSGQPDWGVGRLIRTQQVKRLISAYVGENPEVERNFLNGQLELEITPQGNLAEKLRAASAGIPAFYTPTGVGTLIQIGGIPIKYGTDRKPSVFSQPKETRVFNGMTYMLEEAMHADFALVKAWMADTQGNVIFRKSARNFNPVMCKAAKTAIVEVEQIVEKGQLNPDHVHLPSIYVDRIVQCKNYQKRIAKLVTAKTNIAGQQEMNIDQQQQSTKKSDIKENMTRLTIAKRAAMEIKDGIYANLGVGIPSLCLRFVDKNVKYQIQSENGILGLGPYPTENEVDPDLVNAGKETATVLPGASFFSSDDSFAMIRGGHIDITILGAMQVSQYGDLANWMIPDKSIKGMGGAMDLVSAPGSRVIITMEHTAKGQQPKILPECTLPLTGKGVVSQIITEKCVFEVDRQSGLVLTELAVGSSLEDVKQWTPCNFKISENLKTSAY